MSCLIAAPCSGSGKTLLSLCLAALERRRGRTLQLFKVGPDYLDPQLLGAVSGRPCRNLDPLLCGEEWVRRCFHHHGSRADAALVEGVMGLFDGRGPGSEGSSAAVAALLDLPVVLVVEASRQAGSLAALVRGFRDHGPPAVRLAGVVLNRVGSPRHRALLAEALEAIAVPLLGVLPGDPALELPSRHLGLLPPGELADLGQRQRQWADLACQHLDLERFEPLLTPPPPLAGPAGADPVRWCLAQATEAGEEALESAAARPPLVIAVARDAAFHFRYPETAELLRAVGFEPRHWSPLADQPLPPDCRAVLIPGGYPELHAAQLASSRRSLDALTAAAQAGMPLVAECGGLLLLGAWLEDGRGLLQPMAGVLPFTARRGDLSLGYRTAEALSDGLLLRRGERLVGHEFHRWQLQPHVAAGPRLWQLEGWGSARRDEGWTTASVHASWLHLHWAGCPEIPWRLSGSAARVAPLPMSAVSCSPRPRPRHPSGSAGA
ncbi:MAG: cobyrinate a,c-diamide synthase [Synechococcaceae cyanobacterium]|nr:cobyrinate a,c-diamide synthase [Synechococcaceae cyanobacterium]